MILYSCLECGENTYTKERECECGCKEFEESEGTEEEILFLVVREIALTSGEYEQIFDDQMEEKVSELLKQEYNWTNLSSALEKAVKKNLFDKRISYITGS